MLLAATVLALLAPAPAASAQATLRGTVRDQADDAPVSGAQVSLPALRRGAVTDSLGRFAVEGIPGGTHDVEVQRLGYAPLRLRVAVSAGAANAHTLLLEAAPTDVAPVTVTGTSVSPRMRAFDARRQRGTGLFLDRKQLERHGDRRMSEVLRRSAPGLRMVGSSDGTAVHLATDRNTGASAGALSGRPPRPCFAQVFVDGMRIYGQSWGADDASPPPDIDSFAPHGTEAIEFYRTPATTPAEFRTDTSQCGTLVVWTRDR